MPKKVHLARKTLQLQKLPLPWLNSGADLPIAIDRGAPEQHGHTVSSDIAATAGCAVLIQTRSAAAV